MLLFYPPLPGWPAVGPVPTGAPTQVATEAAIKSSFVPLLSGSLAATPTNLSIHALDIVGAMLADANFGLPHYACLAICQSLFDTPSGQITGKLALELLPTHIRRFLSEVSSCAISLAVANAVGYVFLGHKRDFNQIWGPAPIWTSLWEGAGPDYILHDPSAFAFRFLEVKGHWGAAFATPPIFSRYKTQSLNAEVTVSTVGGHILSYSNLSPGIKCSVQWFNNKTSVENSANGEELALKVALTQFIRELLNAGYEDLGRSFMIPLQEPNRARIELITRAFSRRGDYWVERDKRELLFAFDSSSVRIFGIIAQRNWVNRPRRISRLFALLKGLRLDRPNDSSADGLHLLYRSGTGVSLLSATPKAELERQFATL